MVKNKLLCLIAIFFLCCGISCAQAGKVLVLDDFEGDIIQGQTIDAGAGSGSSIEVSGDKMIKECGEQSFKITYDAVAGGYMWAARGFGLDVKGAAQWSAKPEQVDWSKYGALSFYMKGSALKARMAFDVKDAGGEIFRFMVTDDSDSWKLVICPFDQFFARGDWQPDNAEKNGTLDFPIKSFQFEMIAVSKGTVNIDEVRLEPLN